MGYAQTLPPHSSGVSIIIVGCGFAGLACAIESVRKGHKVVVLEKYKQLKMLGDMISFGFNTGRFFMRWGLHEKIRALCAHASFFHIHSHTGGLVSTQPLPQGLYNSWQYNGNRGEIYEVLLRYAQSIGVTVRFGQSVEEYYEAEAEGEEGGRGRAGVVVNGGRMEADIVVGADGVKSAARKLVLGHEDKPVSSGYAIYRVWYDAVKAGISDDPLTEYLGREQDVLYGWIGRDMHFLAANCKKGAAVSCILMHPDHADIKESWSFPAKNPLRGGWDPRCAAIISKAPPECMVDWKIVYREPMETWVSPMGRMCLIGDAAHPFLPTSAQGASQAVEDGVALAACLQLAGKDDIPLAVSTWEALRYERVLLALKLGESTHEKWHRRPSNASAEESEVDLPQPEWLFDFDAERDVYERWNDTSTRIRKGGYQKPGVQRSNIPSV
ncbi:FAD/NAD-P-binding domain-containing protein [Stereum hirsutum FP-91666 SS1]|uniref:FAD/NAD-P-binding domain-containing protein n=1 Tax=Stereum hirsutum (strain FP-91666) TaxID=721885 RepID=UPI0004409F0C|nr:FAD/NAD-P-binding domain-containing protein [Stereum hirsutum FP-91666 SS1]EIM86375.1 FAD/NAD-P-binding domain-containing protein [Stereum hirsutum FP-91666 SS1]